MGSSSEGGATDLSGLDLPAGTSFDRLVTASLDFSPLMSVLNALVARDRQRGESEAALRKEVETLRGDLANLTKRATASDSSIESLSNRIGRESEKTSASLRSVKDAVSSATAAAEQAKSVIAACNTRVDDTRERMSKDSERLDMELARIEEARKEQAHVNRRAHFTAEKVTKQVDEIRKEVAEVARAQRDVKTDILIVEGKLAELGNPRFRVDDSTAGTGTSAAATAAALAAAAASSSSAGSVAPEPLTEEPESEEMVDTALFTLDRFAQVDQWGASASRRVMVSPDETFGRSFVDEMIGDTHRTEVRAAVEETLHRGVSAGPITIPVHAPVAAAPAAGGGGEKDAAADADAPASAADAPASAAASTSSTSPTSSPPPPQVPVQVTLEPRVDQFDAVVGVTVHGRGFTSLADVDQDLVKEELLESGDLCAVDKAGKITRWSKTLERATGIDQASAWSKSLYDFVHPPSVQETRKVLDLVAHGREGLAVVIPFATRGDGSIVKVRAGLKKDMSARGTVVGVQLVGELTTENLPPTALDRAKLATEEGKKAQAEKLAAQASDPPRVQNRTQLQQQPQQMQPQQMQPQQMQPQQMQQQQQHMQNAGQQQLQTGRGSYYPPAPAPDSQLGPAPVPGVRRGVLLAVDRAGRVQRWSDTAEQMLGLGEEAVVGLSITRDLVAGEEAVRELTDLMSHCVTRGAAVESVHLPLTYLGRTASLRVDLLPRMDADGAVIGVTAEADLLQTGAIDPATLPLPTQSHGDIIGFSRHPGNADGGSIDELYGPGSGEHRGSGRRRRRNKTRAGLVKDRTDAIIGRSSDGGEHSATDDGDGDAGGGGGRRKKGSGADADRKDGAAERKDAGGIRQPPSPMYRSSSSVTVTDPRVVKELREMSDGFKVLSGRAERTDAELKQVRATLATLSDLAVQKADAESVFEAIRVHREEVDRSVKDLAADVNRDRENLASKDEAIKRVSRELRQKASRAEFAKLKDTLQGSASILDGALDAAVSSRPLGDSRCLSCHRPLPHTHHYSTDDLQGTVSSPSLVGPGMHHSPSRPIVSGGLPERGLSNAPRVHLERDQQGRKGEVGSGWGDSLSSGYTAAEQQRSRASRSAGGSGGSAGVRRAGPIAHRYDTLNGTIATSGGHPTPPRTAPAGSPRRPKSQQQQPPPLKSGKHPDDSSARAGGQAKDSSSKQVKNHAGTLPSVKREEAEK